MSSGQPAKTKRYRGPSFGSWRTVGLYGITLWAVVTVVFLLPRLLPGDPLGSLSDPSSGQFLYDPVLRAKIAAFYGLNRPLVDQYLTYLSGLVHGQLGWSISQNLSVNSLIARRLPWTLLLMGSALALSSAFSFFAGASAAWHRGNKADRAFIWSLSAARTIPEYAMASIFLVCFAVLLPVLPLSGAQTPFADYSSPLATFADIARHLVLPVLALSIGLAANKFLIVRNSVIATLGEDYMLLARAKGLDRRRLKYHHSGRNVMLPFLTAFGIQAGFAVGGAIFVETVFAYPGMGTLMSAAVTARDYPLLQGSFVVLALVVLVANLAVELAYPHFDPRVRR